MRWGATPAAGYKAAASRYPDRLALIDESGTLTFQEVHERSNALAHALAKEGVGPGSRVGIMCRNHRGWVEAYVATNKLGAHALFFNTAFSGPQMADVAEREDPVAIIFDEEFAGVLDEASKGRKRFIAWHEPDTERDGPHARRADRGRRPVRPRAAEGAGQGADPDLRHDRHAEGREPQAAAVARSRRRAAGAHPAQGARAHDDRRADVPLLGLRALHAGHGPLLDDRAQAQVRPRGSRCRSPRSTRPRR